MTKEEAGIVIHSLETLAKHKRIGGCNPCGITAENALKLIKDMERKISDNPEEKAVYVRATTAATKKTTDEVLLALSLCSPDGRCAMETNPECPYRVTDFHCERAQLMKDAADVITGLQADLDGVSDTLTEIKNLLGCNCEECDRW